MKESKQIAYKIKKELQLDWIFHIIIYLSFWEYVLYLNPTLSQGQMLSSLENLKIIGTLQSDQLGNVECD